MKQNLKNNLKHLPNLITLLRILLAGSLLFMAVSSWEFITVYLLCGLTDAIDGFMARKLKAVSLMGARLDTISDIVMFAVIFYIFIPRIVFTPALVVWLLVILLVRLGSMALVYGKYHKFAMLHKVSNKVTGFLEYADANRAY